MSALIEGSGTGRDARRRELLADSALAVGLAAIVTLGTFYASQNQPARRPADVGTVALIVIAAGALAARRLFPVAVLVVVFGAFLAYQVIGFANRPIWLTLILAYVTAVLRGHRVAAGIVAVVGFLCFPWVDYLLRDGGAPSLIAIAGLAAWLIVLLGGAEFIRIRRERMAEAVRIREEETLRRASDERLRIARELHDALGHHLSLINVQSGVALHLNANLPEQMLR
jgi:signal transduction histidine kinase